MPNTAITMKSQYVTLGLAALASAHTTMTTLFVDGVNQGDGVCVRMHDVAELSSDPVPIDSSLMACGTFPLAHANEITVT